MDENHELSDAELEDSGSAGRSSDDGSHSGSDPISSDESSEEDSNDELSGSATLAPYSFEPSDSDSASALPDDDGDDARDERLSDTSWCTCGHCSIMESGRECVCCKEISMIMDKLDELEESSHVRVGCITEHPGFATVCLDVWVLQTAYYQYRQHYGSGTTAPPINERYRYTAYRQLVRWCWGWLGRDIRVVLPACSVIKIRDTFPSESYRGFQYPTI